jgi:hypothetical protein
MEKEKNRQFSGERYRNGAQRFVLLKISSISLLFVDIFRADCDDELSFRSFPLTFSSLGKPEFAFGPAPLVRKSLSHGSDSYGFTEAQL